MQYVVEDDKNHVLGSVVRVRKKTSYDTVYPRYSFPNSDNRSYELSEIYNSLRIERARLVFRTHQFRVSTRL
jgi:hypothetical protein